MKLRPYQATAVASIQTALFITRSVVAVSPTGSGKTVIGAAVAAPQSSVVWLAHRYELLGQALKHLGLAGVRGAGLLSGRATVTGDGVVTVASVDMSVDTLRPALERASLVVIDEAHRALAPSYRAALALAPQAQVLGLTATPWRLDGKGLGSVFKHLHVCATQTELIADRFIPQPITYGVSRDDARELVRGVASARGDFEREALGRKLSTRMLMGRVVSEWRRLAAGRSTLVFAATRAHAQALRKQFGRGWAYLDGETPGPQRDAMLEQLADGLIQGVVSVDVLTEGFDCPAVECIVLARPTKSLTLFLQQVGRGARSKRRRPIVLDHAGNTWRFGLPEAEREWSLSDRPRGSGEAPMWRCVCGVMNDISSSACYECGELRPRERAEIEEQEAELERVAALEAERAAARLRIEAVAKARNAPRGWVDQVLTEMGL